MCGRITGNANTDTTSTNMIVKSLGLLSVIPCRALSDCIRKVHIGSVNLNTVVHLSNNCINITTSALLVFCILNDTVSSMAFAGSISIDSS
jgi:hypothetical protein